MLLPVGRKAVEAPNTEKLRAEALALVAKLGDDDYQEREKAQERLENMPLVVLETIRSAVEQATDPEIKLRGKKALEKLDLDALLDSIGVQWNDSHGESVR
jgi:hypothetical protein